MHVDKDLSLPTQLYWSTLIGCVVVTPIDTRISGRGYRLTTDVQPNLLSNTVQRNDIVDCLTYRPTDRPTMMTTTSTSSASRRFTDELKNAAGEQWNRIVNHKFTVELADGTLDNNVLKKYLIQDHRFLDSFVVLLSSMIANCRTLTDRIPGCQFLALITGKENTYFERSFDKLDISNEERLSTPDDNVTTKFINLMRTVAKKGSLGEMLAVLVVCEWSYLSWAEEVQKTDVVKSTNEIHTEWIDLHCGEYFTSVVEYLRNLLDKEGKLSGDTEKETYKKTFLETVALEEEFFDNAYK